MRRKGNFAGRAGGWSAEHWKTATVAWLAFVIAAFVMGGMVGGKKLADADTGSGETARAQATLKAAGFVQPAGENVLVRSATSKAGEPAFEAALAAVVERLSRMPDVQNLVTPFSYGAEGTVSADGHSALVKFEIRGDAQDAVEPKVIEPILAAVAAAHAEHPGFRIEEFGTASARRRKAGSGAR